MTYLFDLPNTLFISIDFFLVQKEMDITLIHLFWIGKAIDFRLTAVIIWWSESGFQVFATLNESLEQQMKMSNTSNFF